MALAGARIHLDPKLEFVWLGLTSSSEIVVFSPFFIGLSFDVI